MSNGRHALDLIAEAQLGLGMRPDISLGVVGPEVFERIGAALDTCEFRRQVIAKSPTEVHVIDALNGRFRYAGHQVEVRAQLDSRDATADELRAVLGAEARVLPPSATAYVTMEGA